MATISTRSETKVYQIKKWLGLNESPDGDTHMELGEAAVMRNFRITAESHMQIRPGYGQFAQLAEGHPVRGLWAGYVKGSEHLVAACGGKLWDIGRDGKPTDKGAITDGPTSFFGFADKLYILTGSEYYSWDGSGAPAVVEGYTPTVITASPPAGGGTVLDGINLLSKKRIGKFSGDGKATVYQLPEKGITSVDKVEGTAISYTTDLAKGQVTFSGAPPLGINNIIITWSKADPKSREKITKMRFAELYNGESDSRVFLYGDGTNEAIFSGLDDKGKATAEYFPALNSLAVGSSNTPITSMIRHYDRLLIYKTDSTWSCVYAPTVIGGLQRAAFRVSTLNREIGNQPPGQVRLVDNSARALTGRSVYEWGLIYGSVRDERNAKRISDRVARSLGSFDLPRCLTFDFEWDQEYWVINPDGRAVIHNYRVDAWYLYTDLPISAIVGIEGRIFFGTPSGGLMELSRKYRNDNKTAISAYYESGSMDFDLDWRRKYSAIIWVGLKPEAQGRITVTAQSNRKSDYARKVVACSLASFKNASFAHWSFKTNRKPQVYRVKLKVKKFTFYKLLFESKSSSATATILATDFQVRYTGNVK